MRTTTSNKKIILGTVQLGMNYGLSKNNLYKSKTNIIKILSYARNRNIEYLDTARAYGSSETNIGYYHSNKKDKFKIITKLKNLSGIKKKYLEKEIFENVAKSRFFLQKSKIDILLIHNYKDLIFHKKEIIKYLKKLKKIGLINEIGVSVYTPEEAIKCLKIKMIKHIQIPFNIIDQRWFKKSFKKKLSIRPDVKIHARSIFLQGLLLNKKNYWPKWFKNKNKVIKNIEFLIKKLDKSDKVDLCLSYVKSFDWINYIVIGINNIKQLKRVLAMHNNKKLSSYQRAFVVSKMRKIASNRSLLPYRWKEN